MKLPGAIGYHVSMKTALLLIAHGSREATANEDLAALARDFVSHLDYAIVEAAYLELAGPRIDAGAAACVEAGVGRVILLPYFLAAGVHVRRDLTEARRRLAARYPEVDFILAEPLGRHPLLFEIVQDRAREAIEAFKPR